MTLIFRENNSTLVTVKLTIKEFYFFCYRNNVTLFLLYENEGKHYDGELTVLTKLFGDAVIKNSPAIMVKMNEIEGTIKIK